MSLGLAELAGHWKLRSLDHRFDDGPWQSAGDWTGWLTYGPGHRVSVLMIHEPTRSTPYLAADELVSYVGTVQLSAPDTVQHHIELSARLSWIGTTQTRLVHIEEDTLELTTPPFTTRRGAAKSRLVWLRVREGQSGAADSR